MIAVIDYGMGNVGSVLRAFAKLGIPAKLTREPGEVIRAENLILAGVGSFDKGMQEIEKSGLRDLLERVVIKERKPLLGICLGMQMLFEGSEEGTRKGLCWIPGRCVRFDATKLVGLKIPHMGWNEVRPIRENALIPFNQSMQRFYFVHSYHAVVSDTVDLVAEAKYGYSFPAAVERDNIMGVQFHPEKSHLFGLNLLERFSGIQKCTHD